ncbi:MAG: hypothetical protein LBE07_04060 [Gordonia sp. (in: high G+C Gram-positive bacteria)]|jgi:hypothetical protein|nr:hypothetical protein [Gordonia sp. (in: high G+C Gram-positive bacteria)]
MPDPTPTTLAPIYVECTSAAAVADLVAFHPAGQVSVLAAALPVGVDAPRIWWPLLDQCTDRRIADHVADKLTRDLPPSLVHLTPEAATLLSGALHASSFVGWPTVTLTHILESGAVATIVELLTGQADELALDVAAAAGPSNPDHARVITAAAIGAQQLHHSDGLITGPTRAGMAVGPMLAGTSAPVIAVHDDGSTVVDLILSRLRFLGATVLEGWAAA